MNDIDMDELFHGKEIADKAKLFKAEMDAINEKHKDFFKERKSHFPSQEHDSVYNHWATYTSNGTVTFNFTDEELPEHIKSDCVDAFKKVYDGAKQNPPQQL